MAEGEPEGRIPLELKVSGAEGAALRVQASAWGHEAVASSQVLLTPSRGGGLDEALLRDKLGAFGGTVFRLASLDVSGLKPGLHLAVSELKALRRPSVLTPRLALVRPRRELLARRRCRGPCPAASRPTGRSARTSTAREARPSPRSRMY